MVSVEMCTVKKYIDKAKVLKTWLTVQPALIHILGGG